MLDIESLEWVIDRFNEINMKNEKTIYWQNVLHIRSENLCESE